MINRDDSQPGNGRSSDRGEVFDLSPEDQRMFDALVEAGFDRAKLPQPLSARDEQRAAALLRLMGYLDDYPVDDAEPALVHAALARIDRYEDQHAQRLRFDVAEQARAGRGFRVRMPDFITVAAVILIGVGVMWPVLGSMRQRSMEVACGDNLKRLGYAFSQYSNDNDGSLPVATAGMGDLGGTWDTVRNALHLNPLIDGKYCDAGHLNCPGHHDHDQIGPSYSYRWFTPGGAVHWQSGRMTLILGDLNPLIDAARSGFAAPPLTVSVNHGGRGQNVLASDGATLWLEQPLIGNIGGAGGRGDNIWMPNNVDVLRPGVAPADDLDVFLAH